MFLYCNSCANTTDEHEQHYLKLFRKLSNPNSNWTDWDNVNCFIVYGSWFCDADDAYKLPDNWHLSENGGFDGRWVQLFDDSKQPFSPFQLFLDYYPGPNISAKKSIILKPGFHVQGEILGTAFRASIQTQSLLTTAIPQSLNKETTADQQNQIQAENPIAYRLFQNYPNPFNPMTTIRYNLPEESEVILTIYNILGQEVITLINARQLAGLKSVDWSGKNDKGMQMPSGIYIYRLKTEKFTKAKKMIMIK